MKKKNYDFMTQYESNMLTSSTVGYTRNIPRKDVKKIVEVYKEETGKENDDNPYCSGCLVNMLSELKALFDAHSEPEKIENDGRKKQDRQASKVRDSGTDAGSN